MVFGFEPLTARRILSCWKVQRSWWRDRKTRQYEEQLRSWGWSVWEEDAKGRPRGSLQLPEEAAVRRMSVSFLRWQVIRWEEMDSGCSWGGLDSISGRIYLWRRWPDVRTGCPGRRWSPWRYLRHGLVMGLRRSGWWLDLVIMNVFSNLDDSIFMYCKY